MKHLLLLLTLFLVGCSGHYSKTVATDENGVPMTRFFGLFPVYNVEKTSRSSIISTNHKESVVEVAKHQKDAYAPCNAILTKTMTTASGEAEQMRAYSSCVDDISDGKSIAVALDRPTTDVAAMSRETYKAIDSVEDNQTERTLGVASATFKLGTAVEVNRSVRNGQDALRDVGVAAAENSGDTSIGSINASQTQNVSNSNDPVGGAAGEGAGGTATGTTSTTNTMGNLNLAAGRGTSATMANDNARVFDGTRSTVQADASANATALGNDPNVDVLNNVDSQNNSPVDNDPCVGCGSNAEAPDQ